PSPTRSRVVRAARSQRSSTERQARCGRLAVSRVRCSGSRSSTEGSPPSRSSSNPRVSRSSTSRSGDVAEGGKQPQRAQSAQRSLFQKETLRKATAEHAEHAEILLQKKKLCDLCGPCGCFREPPPD